MVDMDNVVYAMKEMASQLEKNEITYNQYKPIVSDLCRHYFNIYPDMIAY